MEMMGLILLTRYASALRLMLGASHLVALHATLAEQSSSARLQASLQTRSASIIWCREQPSWHMTVACAARIEEALK